MHLTQAGGAGSGRLKGKKENDSWAECGGLIGVREHRKRGGL